MDVSGEMIRGPLWWRPRWWPWSRCNFDAADRRHVFQPVLDGFEFATAFADCFDGSHPARRAAQTAARTFSTLCSPLSGIPLTGMISARVEARRGRRCAPVDACALLTFSAEPVHLRFGARRLQLRRRTSSALRTAKSSRSWFSKMRALASA